jgi:serine/threonine protein kinase
MAKARFCADPTSGLVWLGLTVPVRNDQDEQLAAEQQAEVETPSYHNEVWIFNAGDHFNASLLMSTLRAAGALCGLLEDIWNVSDKVLGRGAFTEVRRAERNEHANPEEPEHIAVKIMSETKFVDLMILKKEIAILAIVSNHPNIIGFHGVFQVGQSSWGLTMQCCDGGDLYDQVVRLPLTESKALIVLDGVLSGLVHVHSLGFVHRDIKAENLLIDSSGQAVIVDFGIAHLESDRKAMSKRKGSPGYIAPEMLLGQFDQCNCKLDTFSVGVLLFFVMSGRLPFTGSNIGSIFKKTIACTFNFDMSPRFQSVSQKVKDQILWLCRRQPGDRPSCEKALRAVRRLMQASAKQHRMLKETEAARVPADKPIDFEWEPQSPSTVTSRLFRPQPASDERISEVNQAAQPAIWPPEKPAQRKHFSRARFRKLSSKDANQSDVAEPGVHFERNSMPAPKEQPAKLAEHFDDYFSPGMFDERTTDPARFAKDPIISDGETTPSTTPSKSSNGQDGFICWKSSSKTEQSDDSPKNSALNRMYCRAGSLGSEDSAGVLEGRDSFEAPSPFASSSSSSIPSGRNFFSPRMMTNPKAPRRFSSLFITKKEQVDCRSPRERVSCTPPPDRASFGSNGVDALPFDDATTNVPQGQRDSEMKRIDGVSDDEDARTTFDFFRRKFDRSIKQEHCLSGVSNSTSATSAFHIGPDEAGRDTILSEGLRDTLVSTSSGRSSRLSQRTSIFSRGRIFKISSLPATEVRIGNNV